MYGYLLNPEKASTMQRLNRAETTGEVPGDLQLNEALHVWG